MTGSSPAGQCNSGRLKSLPDFDALEQQYQHVLLNFPDCPVVLAGDLNCDLLSTSSASRTCLNEYLDKYSINQVITVPTYSTGSLLDVIISNRGFLRSGTRFCHFSPHHFTRALLSLPRPRFKPRVVECRSFKRFDLLRFETELFATNWSAVYSSPTVTAASSAFLCAITPTVQRYALVKSITLRNPMDPPISAETKLLLLHRSETLRVYGHGPAEYRTVNRKPRSAFRAEKKQYVSDRIRVQGRVIVWKSAKDIVGSKRPDARTLPSAPPDALNDFFAGVGPRAAAELDSYGPAPSLPTRLPRVGACAFTLHPISLISLHKIISSMRNSSARGDDGLCIRILKLSFSTIGHVLLYIINLCITANDILDLWKHAQVYPIHKSGDPSDPSNFRPIPILTVISKIVERVVQRQLYYYLSANHLLSSIQHGFRPRHSTETAPTYISDEILAAFDSGKISLLCLIDLSKCFDVISHGKLLDKLQTLGINTSWFRNYLHGHTQCVRYTGFDGLLKISSPREINQGVFQGSSLGPILFSAFANDLSLHAADALVVQYADDTQVLVSEPKSSLPVLIARMESALSSLGDYFHSNGLKANVAKFELLTLGTRQNLRSLPSFTVNFRGTSLTPTTVAKNLGVLFDQHLSWDAHVSAVSRKCCGILTGLSHLRHYLPPETLPEIVNALVISHIRYGLVVYDNGSSKNQRRIQKLLNFAARVISENVNLTMCRMCVIHYSGFKPPVPLSTRVYVYSRKSALPANLNPWQICFLSTEKDRTVVGRRGRTTYWPCLDCAPRLGSGGLRTGPLASSTRCLRITASCRLVGLGGL